MKIIFSIFKFYHDGFKSMPNWGRKMWLIIFIKLFIMFAILKLIFFPNFLNNRFESEKEKGDYILEQLTNKEC